MLDAPTRESVIAQLNELIALDHNAIAAYDAAIARLESPDIRSQLLQYRDDHDRHVEFLQSKVRSLGGEPQQGVDAKSLMTRGLVVVADSMGDDESILKAMKTNEDQTNQAYELAVDRLTGLVEVETLLKENLRDERMHRAWIESAITQIH